MEIKLPGMETAIENQVYAETVTTQSNEGAMNLQRVVLPKRYAEPTGDVIAQHVQKAAENVAGVGTILLTQGARDTRERTPLEDAIIDLPVELRRDLSNGKPEYMQFFEANASGEGPAKNYIGVTSGFIPLVNVRQAQQAGQIKDASWYEHMLNTKELRKYGLGEQWTAGILCDGRKLPSDEVLNVLIDNGVVNSRTLSMGRGGYDPTEVKVTLSRVHSGLETEDHMMQLRDISELLLERTSINSLVALAQHIMQKTPAGRS